MLKLREIVLKPKKYIIEFKFVFQKSAITAITVSIMKLPSSIPSTLIPSTQEKVFFLFKPTFL